MVIQAIMYDLVWVGSCKDDRLLCSYDILCDTVVICTENLLKCSKNKVIKQGKNVVIVVSNNDQ